MTYKYNAFISYRHEKEDMKIAEHLHDSLERYHIPRYLRKQLNITGNLNIFRDKYDLPVTDSLNDTIRTALSQSQYLIVICSSHTKESVWVQKEIELFLTSHSRKNILTVLVDGEPCDVIPDILLYEEKKEISDHGETVIVRNELEPLSADYRQGIKTSKKEELPRLVSGLLGCSYEDLVRRQQQHKNKIIALASLSVVSLVTIASLYILWTSMKIQDNYEKSLFNQSEYLAAESILEMDEDNNRELAAQLALAAVPQKGNDMPFNPHAQFALFNATGAYSLPNDYQYIGIQSFMANGGEQLYNLASNKEGTYVAADSINNFYLWDVSSGKLVKKVKKSGDITFHFTESKLWTFSLGSIKSYSLDNLSDESNPLEEYTDAFIGGYTYTENKVYILCQNYDYTNGDLSPFIRIVDKKTARTISDIPLHNTLGESMVTARIFCVSPDDKYACMVTSNDPVNIKPDKLVIINLDSGKTRQKTIDWATDDNVYITDLCFNNHDLILSGSSYYMEPESDFSLTYGSKKKNNILVCYDLSHDKYKWSSSGLAGKSVEKIQLQCRCLKERNSGKYQKVVVMVLNNLVTFIQADNGKILQTEDLSQSRLKLLGHSSSVPTDNIHLYAPDEQLLITLDLDNDDGNIYFQTTQLVKREITDISFDPSQDQNMFVCCFNEIIQLKKGQYDTDCTELDKNPSIIDDQFSFEGYLATLATTPDESSSNVKLCIYDLEKKRQVDQIELQAYKILGIISKDILILQESEDSRIFYCYHLKNKQLDQLMLKFDDTTSINSVIPKVIGDRLLILYTSYENGHYILQEASCNPSKDKSFKIHGQKAVFSSITDIQHLSISDDGTIAYIEYKDKKKELLSLESGDISTIASPANECIGLIWADGKVGIYDGEKLVICDSHNGRELLTIKNNNIISYDFDRNDLYYLLTDGQIYRYSLENGQKEHSLISRYKKMELYYNTSVDLSIDTSHKWFIDNQNIKILSNSTIIEVDKKTLELIGYADNICCYCKDMNCYCFHSPRIGEINLGIIQCYSLNDLIRKGKEVVHDKEMSESNKIRYGLN